MSKNVFNQIYSLSKSDREKIKNQVSSCYWFTGLSGSGKSTLANRLEVRLNKLHKHTYIIDGDNLRIGLNSDLEFSSNDRDENIRRAAEVANLMSDAGLIIIVALICPLARHRELARNIFRNKNFYEIFLSTPIDVCENRDVKGLYKKARSGQVPNFTGISSPYEIPQNPEFNIDTSRMSIDEALDMIISNSQT